MDRGQTGLFVLLSFYLFSEGVALIIRYLIVTNNPLVAEAFQSSEYLARTHKLCWVQGYTENVLAKVRNLCHKLYRLVTHPLTGSVKPNQAPYKTVVLEPSPEDLIDYQSVITAETSMQKALDMLRLKPRPPLTDTMLADYALIDLDFFKSYLESRN